MPFSTLFWVNSAHILAPGLSILNWYMWKRLSSIWPSTWQMLNIVIFFPPSFPICSSLVSISFLKILFYYSQIYIVLCVSSRLKKLKNMITLLNLCPTKLNQAFRTEKDLRELDQIFSIYKWKHHPLVHLLSVKRISIKAYPEVW